MKKISLALTAALLVLVLSGCNTNPVMGGGQGGGTVTGSAGGGNTQNANSQLTRCGETLGTVSVFEDRTLPWWSAYRHRMPQLGSTVPVIRLMLQQSGCFVVVERGIAQQAMRAERELMQSGELRGGSNFGRGRVVAADYTLNPSVQFAAKGTGGIGAAVGGLLGTVGSVIGGGLKKNEAATTLLLVDNRSGVQVAAAVGNASNYDIGLFGGLFGSGGVGGLGTFSNTPEGKVITASFADSFNQMVAALKNYRAQTVKGGLGKGGRLRISQ